MGEMLDPRNAYEFIKSLKKDQTPGYISEMLSLPYNVRKLKTKGVGYRNK